MAGRGRRAQLGSRAGSGPRRPEGATATLPGSPRQFPRRGGGWGAAGRAATVRQGPAPRARPRGGAGHAGSRIPARIPARRAGSCSRGRAARLGRWGRAGAAPFCARRRGCPAVPRPGLAPGRARPAPALLPSLFLPSLLPASHRHRRRHRGGACGRCPPRRPAPAAGRGLSASPGGAAPSLRGGGSMVPAAPRRPAATGRTRRKRPPGVRTAPPPA